MLCDTKSNLWYFSVTIVHFLRANLTRADQRTTLRASICLSNSTEQDIVKGLAVPCQKRVWTVSFRSLLFASQGTKGLVKNHEGTRNLSGRSIKLT